MQHSSGGSSKSGKALRCSLKVINPAKKSLYSVHSLPDITSKFKSITNVKETLKNFLKSEIKEMGYISPGHGAKGRHNRLINEADLQSMYNEYEGRRGINGVLLWCYGPMDDNSDDMESQPKSASRKRSNSHSKDDKPPSKCAKRMQRIEEIVDELKEKHSELYSLEQYNCWAHTIDMGKHNSYDNPPDLPFFVGKKPPRASAMHAIHIYIRDCSCYSRICCHLSTTITGKAH